MKVLKFSSSRDRIWFGSDFHLGHLRDFVWKPRGFTSHVEHTNAVIDRINKVVTEDDILFYLGDFSLNSNPEETKNFLRRIKCKIFFIWGNHESSTSKIYKEALEDKFGGPVDFEAYPLVWENVTFLGTQAFISIDKQTIFLSHFAHYIWEDMQHGVWHLCGHSHGNCPEINIDATEGKILDVGVDNAIKKEGLPIMTFEMVWTHMQAKKVVVRDHHNRNTT
jgi:calcineurin-like phosphoesterase family protein